MVYSTLIVLALVLVWWSLTYNPTEQQPRNVELDATSAYAVDQADWPVWVPALGDDWTPTVVWFEPLEQIPTWHLSFVTPEGEYLAIHQASEVTPSWERDVLSGGERVGDVVLPGPVGEQTWQVWEAEEGNAENAWVLGPQETQGSTVVLHGTAGQAEAEELLRAVQPRD